jgi:acyl dehydratase
MLNYPKLKAFQFPVVEQEYVDKDAFLYALGLGLGSDPLDIGNLRYVYEGEPKVIPTFASVLGMPGAWMRNHPELGITAEHLVHGEHHMRFHRPLPISGKVSVQSEIGRVVDKGQSKGGLIELIRTVRDHKSADLLVTSRYVLFCRTDGGFKESSGFGDDPSEPLSPTPEDRPHAQMEWRTRPDAALIYRLSGDRNPLHADPAVASRAGFERPILHGLATFGIACASLIRMFCANDPAKVLSMAGRFSAPVYPGDVLEVKGWESAGQLAFQVALPDRKLVAISNGVAILT